MKEKEFSLKTNIKLQSVVKGTTDVIETRDIHNIITTVGLEQVNDFLNGGTPTAPTHVGIGEGVTAETVGDTALQSEVDRGSVTVTEPSSVTTQYKRTFTFGSGISYDITELGLFDAPSGGNMYNRATFGALAVGSDIDLITTITFTVSQ